MNDIDKISINMPTEWKYNRQSVIMPLEERIDPLKVELVELQQRMLCDWADQIKEEETRNSNPTLKDAWDKYQMLLKLVIK